MAESYAGELSVNPGHHEPSLRPRVGDAQAESRQVSIVVLHLPSFRRLKIPDGGGGEAELRHGLRLRSGYEMHPLWAVIVCDILRAENPLKSIIHKEVAGDCGTV